jgi:hypothetical protein
MIPSNVHSSRKSHTFYENNVYYKHNLRSSSTLQMEAVCSSKMSVNYDYTRWCYILENGTLHSHCCENLNNCRTVQNKISFKTCHDFGAFKMTKGLPSSGTDSKTLANPTIKYLKAIMYRLCSYVSTLFQWFSAFNITYHICASYTHFQQVIRGLRSITYVKEEIFTDHVFEALTLKHRI